MKKIFVGNLSWKTTEEQLKAHFEVYGQVLSAKIVTDKTTGRSKGFGFVEMAEEDGAANAIRELNGKPLLDRSLRLSLAQERDRTERREREPRGESSYGGGRSNFRSGPSNFSFYWTWKNSKLNLQNPHELFFPCILVSPHLHNVSILCFLLGGLSSNSDEPRSPDWFSSELFSPRSLCESYVQHFKEPQRREFHSPLFSETARADSYRS